MYVDKDIIDIYIYYIYMIYMIYIYNEIIQFYHLPAVQGNFVGDNTTVEYDDQHVDLHLSSNFWPTKAMQVWQPPEKSEHTAFIAYVEGKNRCRTPCPGRGWMDCH